MALVPGFGGRNPGRDLTLAAAGIAANQIVRNFADNLPGTIQSAYQTGRNYWNTPRDMKRTRPWTYNATNTTRFKKPRYVQRNNVRTGGLTGIEVKYADFSGAVSGITTPQSPTRLPLLTGAGSVDHCSPAAEGNGPTGRIGRNIWVKSIQLSLNAQLDPGSSGGGVAFKTPKVTFFVVLDKQANSTTPAAAAIWDYAPGAEALEFRGDPFINLEYKDRFRILGRKKITLRNADTRLNATANISFFDGDIRFKKWYKSWKTPWKQQYDGASGAIASVTNEAITIWYTVDFVENNVVQVAAIGRCRFTG